MSLRSIDLYDLLIFRGVCIYSSVDICYMPEIHIIKHKRKKKKSVINETNHK